MSAKSLATKNPKNDVAPLRGFVFNEELGLYVADSGFRQGLGLLGSELGVKNPKESRELLKSAYVRCQEIYGYIPAESGINVFVYLAAGKSGLISDDHEDIEFTFEESLGLAKSLGVRVGTNREFMLYDRMYGSRHVPLLLGDVYDFTRDDTKIDVYLGIVTVLKDGKKYKFLDENSEPIIPVRLKGAQAKALRQANVGKIDDSRDGIVVYEDKSVFLQSGKRVSEFDEQGIPCAFDNREYGCIPKRGRYSHDHRHVSEFIGHRWVVEPEKGLVVMHIENTEYWKPDGNGMYRNIGHIGPTTYLTQAIDETLERTNIFAVAGLENKVEEFLRTLTTKDHKCLG